MAVTSTPLYVNYVATYPMHSTLNKKKYLPSSDLDLVVDMVVSSIGILETNIHTHVAALDMYSFQSVVFTSSKDLLEAMTEACPFTCIQSIALSSWKS